MSGDFTPGTGNVQVEFEGLMVGRYNPARHVFEMAILQVGDGIHVFNICYQIDGVKQPPPSIPTEGTWHLGIVAPDNQVMDADTSLLLSSGPFDRLGPASQAFDWVLDVENRLDFPHHPRPITFNPPDPHTHFPSLRPLIEIRNGVLFSKLISESLHQHVQGRGGSALGTGPEKQIVIPFGRATKVIGLDMKVLAGNDVVLWKASPAEFSFRIPVTEGHNIQIFITNTDSPSGDDCPAERRADFHKYYDLFNVPREHQCELWNLSTPLPTLVAELAPTPKAPTCKDLLGIGAPGPLCGAVHLSQFSGPLSN